MKIDASAQLIPYNGHRPQLAGSVYVATGVVLVGSVFVAEGASIWFNAVLRADYEPIHIGKNTNIQDGTVVHIDHGFPTVVGDDVTVGHAAVIHGAVIGDGALIGMNSTLLTGSRVGAGCLVAAGSVVREHAEFGERALIAGVPAKQIGIVSDDLFERMSENTKSYVSLGTEYLAMLETNGP